MIALAARNTLIKLIRIGKELIQLQNLLHCMIIAVVRLKCCMWKLTLYIHQFHLIFDWLNWYFWLLSGHRCLIYLIYGLQSSFVHVSSDFLDIAEFNSIMSWSLWDISSTMRWWWAYQGTPFIEHYVLFHCHTADFNLLRLKYVILT